MSTERPSLVTAHYILLARSFVVIVGCAAVWWGIVEFPVFWQESSTERIADRIIAGAPFKAAILARQVPIINSIKKSVYCRPSALRSAAIIQLRMVEVATSANDRDHIDEQWKSLGNVIRSSLSCSPADPFLWLILYWMQRNESYLNYLRMSYDLGPNEGWIALKRSPVAFAGFQQLTAELAKNTIIEFSALIDSKLYESAAEIFTGPAWQERELILSHLRRANRQDRQRFSEALQRLGYDVSVPGVGYLD